MTVLSAIRWADVVHWHYATSLPAYRDVKLARWWAKAGVVEFYGSDIRIANIDTANNPYFARYVPKEYVLAHTLEHSRAVQEAFATYGVHCVTYHPMLPYVQHDLFPSPYVVRQRVPVNLYKPNFPNPANKRPVILHCPTSAPLKGTAFVLAAIDQLRGKFDFEFRLVENAKHEEVLAHMANADIYVDQLIGGDHGFAAVGPWRWEHR
jgi:hypothetical protein